MPTLERSDDLPTLAPASGAPVSVWTRLSDPFYTWSWRIPGRAWRRLYAFAVAEAESALELRCAAALTESAERAALYLLHAEDETRHARILVRRAELLRGEGALPMPRPDHAHLFRTLGEDAFLAFVYRGERRGRRQFEAHVRFFAARDPALSTALSSILKDEHHHEAYTQALVAERPASAKRQAQRRDLGFRWRRAGSWLTAPIFAALMIVLFALAAPFGWLASRRGKGWRASVEDS